jgi:DNA invertase Pin-like site-specific DNA recombinase
MSMKRERRQERQARAVALADMPSSPPARPSEYGVEQITADHVAAHQIKQVVLYVRVSTPKQDAGPQRRGCKAMLMGMGIDDVVVVYGGKWETGKSLGFDRANLRRAFLKARRLGCPLVVATMSRLARHWKFHAATNPEKYPSKNKLARLAHKARWYGVKVLTLCNPDASMDEDRAFLHQLSSQFSSRVGRPRKRGRPSKRRRPRRAVA